MLYILTVVILFGTNGTAYTVEYNTQQACESAKQLTRFDLDAGKIVLLTCTKKS
jgi:hypothetical protein